MHIQIIVGLQITWHHLLYKTYLSVHSCPAASFKSPEEMYLLLKGKITSIYLAFSVGATDQVCAQRTDLVCCCYGVTCYSVGLSLAVQTFSAMIYAWVSVGRENFLYLRICLVFVWFFKLQNKGWSNFCL